MIQSYWGCPSLLYCPPGIVELSSAPKLSTTWSVHLSFCSPFQSAHISWALLLVEGYCAIQLLSYLCLHWPILHLLFVSQVFIKVVPAIPSKRKSVNIYEECLIKDYLCTVQSHIWENVPPETFLFLSSGWLQHATYHILCHKKV